MYQFNRNEIFRNSASGGEKSHRPKKSKRTGGETYTYGLMIITTKGRGKQSQAYLSVHWDEGKNGQTHTHGNIDEMVCV